jgi:GT2 family glycosyltransferase
VARTQELGLRHLPSVRATIGAEVGMAQLGVVIPTRNRGAQAADAARAVLQDPCDLELVVVDQSADDSSERELRAIDDARLRVIRSATAGASNARNIGVAATTAPIVAFTDDDCRPAPGWASSLLRIFADDPAAALVFGRVFLPPGAHEIGYAPSFEPKRRIQEREVPLPDGDLGIGANFGVRRNVLESLGGFDPLLGPGAPFFRGAEETDLLIRALHAGLRVVNAAECEVLHLGVRTGDDVRPLHVTYQLAVGAAFGKHARLSGVAGVRDCGRWAAFYARKLARDVLALRRPRPGVLAYFITGAALTYRYGIDPARPVFRERARPRRTP